MNSPGQEPCPATVKFESAAADDRSGMLTSPAMFLRALLVITCVLAAPAAALASALCCGAEDACCSEPCAATDCTTVPDDHCVESAAPAADGASAAASMDLASEPLEGSAPVVLTGRAGPPPRTPATLTPRFRLLQTLRL